MPNYITNKLTIVGTEEQIKEVMDFIKIEETDENEEFGLGTIDFNKITPMPKWVYGSNPKVTGIGFEDEKKYGAQNTSLGWSRQNWGTKWNAFNQSKSRNTYNTIYFETAWNGVPALMQKIAWIFPDVVIEYGYADEDFGANVALYKFKNTEVIEHYTPKRNTKKAYDLAFEITQSTPDEHSLVFNEKLNNYEFQDD